MKQCKKDGKIRKARTQNGMNSKAQKKMYPGNISKAETKEKRDLLLRGEKG